MNDSIRYSALARYKYRLDDDYEVETGICPGRHIMTDYIELSAEGRLYIYTGYAWDGASSVAVDTTTIIRASLIHDALYQLISLGKLSKKYRKAADKILRRISRQDGMTWLRASWVYRAVRFFGGLHCG